MNAIKCPTCETQNDAFRSICIKCSLDLYNPEKAKQLEYYSTPHIEKELMFTQATIICPFCNSTVGTYEQEKVSGAGWAVFVILLLFCIPLCWVGLFIKDKNVFCRKCNMKLS